SPRRRLRIASFFASILAAHGRHPPGGLSAAGAWHWNAAGLQAIERDTDGDNRGFIAALGVWLRIADLAAGLYLCALRARPAQRRAPAAVHLLVPPSRHARAARAGVRAGAWRLVPGHGLCGQSRAVGGGACLSRGA